LLSLSICLDHGHIDDDDDTAELPVTSDVRVAGIAIHTLQFVQSFTNIQIVWEWLPEDVETSLPLQPGDRLQITECDDEWACGTNQVCRFVVGCVCVCVFTV
jgi:hypothetical protein